jgi:hypothetical protein
VAVIIFGHNKKLYEFSSGDINETIGRYQYVCASPCYPGSRVALKYMTLTGHAVWRRTRAQGSRGLYGQEGRRRRRR